MESKNSEDNVSVQLTFGRRGHLEKAASLASKLVRNVTVEPVVFFYSLGFSITIIASPQLYFDKTCKVSTYLDIILLYYNEITWPTYTHRYENKNYETTLVIENMIVISNK